MEQGSYDKFEFRANPRPQLGQNLSPQGRKGTMNFCSILKHFPEEVPEALSSCPVSCMVLSSFIVYGTCIIIVQLRTLLNNFDYNFGHESNNSHDLVTTIALHGLHML